LSVAAPAIRAVVISIAVAAVHADLVHTVKAFSSLTTAAIGSVSLEEAKQSRDDNVEDSSAK
jgi:hypothetical protein